MVSFAIAYALDAVARPRKALPGFVSATIHRMKQTTQHVRQRESWIVCQRFLRSLQHPGQGMQVTVDRAVIRPQRGRG